MMLRKIQIGKLVLTVNASDSLQRNLNYFYSDIKENGIDSKICITINCCKKLPELDDIDNLTPIHMKNIVYFYKKDKCIYIARNEIASGIINMCSESCTWWVLETAYNVRSIFHTCILDPVSLIGVNYGVIVLHASLIECNNKGIIFIGKSGMGKSTVSMLVSQNSEDIFKQADDTVQIDCQTNNIRVIPLFTGEGYIESVADKYLSEEWNMLPNVRGAGKIYYFPAMQQVELPLSEIIILEKTEQDNTFELLNMGDALTEIVKHQTHISGPYLLKWFECIRILTLNVLIFKKKYKDVCNIDEITKKICTTNM